MWESKWEDKPFGEVDSSFGLQRPFSSSYFKGLISQGLNGVEAPYELSCLDSSILNSSPNIMHVMNRFIITNYEGMIIFFAKRIT
jgi:hypothetical protein